MDRQPGESPHRAGDRESHVVRAFRDRAGGDKRRLWNHGTAADSSQVARLACRRIPRQRMERQAYVQADGDVGDVPARLEVEPAAVRQRSEKLVLVARPTMPYGCRDAPLYPAAIRRAVSEGDGR